MKALESFELNRSLLDTVWKYLSLPLLRVLANSSNLPGSILLENIAKRNSASLLSLSLSFSSHLSRMFSILFLVVLRVYLDIALCSSQIRIPN